MLENYEFPKFFFVAVAAILAFVTMEIMEGSGIIEIPDFIEIFVTLLVIISAIYMIRYLLAFVLTAT